MTRPDIPPAADLADLIVKWDLLHRAEGITRAAISVDRKLWDEWVRLAMAVITERVERNGRNAEEA